MPRPLAIFTAMLLTCAASFAGDRPAVKTLSEIPLFAFGGIGVAGTTSNGEIAFREVLDSSSAEADFLRMLKAGTPEAQCYALVGLRLKNRAEFDEQVKRFVASRQMMKTCRGCIMGAPPMSSMVINIQHGNYDESAKAKLRSPR